MIYLDHGATSFPKPVPVQKAVLRAMQSCANPGRGGYGAAMEAAKVVYKCREEASRLFLCQPEQVVFTGNCTHGLNIAIRSLVKPGWRVAVSGFEHNAVMRPLYALGADVHVAGRTLFDWDELLDSFYKVLCSGVDAAVFTHVSNVFGYVLPVEELAGMCREKKIPFIIDAAQSAGSLPVHLRLGANFIAMPGHKGLLGPQGTGILLCSQPGVPLHYGGTGTASRDKDMPEDLPERQEAGTMNVPGIAGLCEGLRYLNQVGTDSVFQKEHEQLKRCVKGLQKLGMRVYSGPHQAATVSFLSGEDCEDAAGILAKQGIAVRAGLHCAPLAHKTAGTLESGTVRVSFGHNASATETNRLLRAASKLTQF